MNDILKWIQNEYDIFYFINLYNHEPRTTLLANSHRN